MKTVNTLTKGHGFVLTLVALLLFSSYSVSAATLTWTAGNANWNIAGNWDLGYIPTATDHVVIPTGRPKIPGGYIAHAMSIDIQTELWVKANGQLLLANAYNKPSMQLSGRLRLNGYLEILNSINTGGALNSGTAIQCSGDLKVKATGSLFIDQADYNSIFLEATGSLSNYGTITIDNAKNTGIYNFGIFNNFASVHITASTGVGQYAIANSNNLNNYAAGSITTMGGGSAAVLNIGGAVISNLGDMEMTAASSHGVMNSGDILNYASGSLKTAVAGFSGFYNRSGANYYNYGYHSSLNAGSDGILNAGAIYNLDLMISTGSSSDMRDYAGATFENSGTVRFLSTTYSLQLNGDLLNSADGYLYLFGNAFVGSTGTMDNYGFLISEYSLNHVLTITGSVVNYGIIIDPYDSFGSAIDNQQVISKPIAGTLQDGVLFNDLLDVVSHSNVHFNVCIAYAGGPVVGVYDEINNTFMPNSSAVGITEFLISSWIDASGNYRAMKVYLDNPVSALVSKKEEPEIEAPEFRTQEVAFDFNAFPNPSTGHLQLRGNLVLEDLQLLVLNALGQVVLKTHALATNELTLPNDLPDGLYHLQFIKDGQPVAAQPILLQRN